MYIVDWRLLNKPLTCMIHHVLSIAFIRACIFLLFLFEIKIFRGVS